MVSIHEEDLNAVTLKSIHHFDWHVICLPNDQPRPRFNADSRFQVFAPLFHSPYDWMAAKFMGNWRQTGGEGSSLDIYCILVMHSSYSHTHPPSTSSASSFDSHDSEYPPGPLVLMSVWQSSWFPYRLIILNWISTHPSHLNGWERR